MAAKSEEAKKPGKWGELKILIYKTITKIMVRVGSEA